MNSFKNPMNDAVGDLSVSDPEVDDVYARAHNRSRRRRAARAGISLVAVATMLVIANHISGSSTSLDEKAIAKPVGQLVLPGIPISVQSSEDTIWVLTCKPCSPEGTGRVSRFSVGDLKLRDLVEIDSPASMVISDGSLWVASLDGLVYRVDEDSGRIEDTVKLPDLVFQGSKHPFFVSNMAGGSESIWVTSAWGSAVRIAADSGVIEDQVAIPRNSGASIAADSGGVWIGLGLGGLLRVEDSGSRSTIQVDSGGQRRLSVDYVSADRDSVTVSGGWTAKLAQGSGPPVYVAVEEAGYAVIDSGTNEIRTIEPLPNGVFRSAQDATNQDVVWYSGQQSKDVVRSDPDADDDVSVRLDAPGLVVAANGDAFWVAREGRTIEEYRLSTQDSDGN